MLPKNAARASRSGIWIGWSWGASWHSPARQRDPQAVAKLVLVGATPKYVQVGRLDAPANPLACWNNSPHLEQTMPPRSIVPELAMAR